MKAKLKFILPLLAAVMLMSSCTSNFTTTTYSNDAKIISENNSVNLVGIEQVVSKNAYEVSVESIEGMETIWSFTAEADKEIELSGKILVENGKAKLVIIYPDNTLDTIIEKDSTSTGESEIAQKLSIKKGVNRIKICATKDTKLEMNLSLPDGKFQKMGIEW